MGSGFDWLAKAAGAVVKGMDPSSSEPPRHQTEAERVRDAAREVTGYTPPSWLPDTPPSGEKKGLFD